MKITGRDLENLTCIFTGRHSLLYFQEASDYNQPVVLKKLRDVSVTSREIEHLGNEYVVTKDLAIQGVRRSYDYIEIEGRPTLVLEFVEGASLRDECRKERMSLWEILHISISIAQTLGELHRNKIVHRNLSSTNLLLDRKNLTITIIDFGIAMTSGLSSAHHRNLEPLDGSYQYISPEQSGRINRLVDFRTDLYSFGVVMYEMLVGRLPFVTSDPLELIHFHIAKDPEPPREVDPRTPSVLSDLVMKLMSKDPQDRYQSAYGLKVDLENCLEQFQDNGVIQPFQLAQEDFPEELRVRQKLYGRESDSKVLKDALENTYHGEGEIVLVSGDPGVGKSFLVDDIEPIVAEKGGYFITGTGDVYRQNTPHYVLLKAFGRYVDLMLMESAENLLQYKEEITQALGKDTALIIEAIPRMELIIGRQPVAEPVRGRELQVRFEKTFLDFVRVIARREHPLVLFIDNVQWVDVSSLRLLQSLLVSSAGQYLLFIGAYRENEVGPSHPFMAVLEDLENQKTVVRKLHLANFSQKTLNNLVSDALGAEPSYTQALSDIIHVKTGGNPISTRWFLQSLSDSSLLIFDPVMRRWKWDEDKIRTMNISDNLITLMIQEIRKLPLETQKVLSMAACIGNKFSLKILSIIAEQSLPDARKHLWSAIDQGLIVPVAEADSSLKKEHVKENACYRFPHVRVRQAAYALMPKKLGRATHVNIGRLRMGNRPIAELGNRLFGITDHFNVGFQEIKNKAEKLMLVELNLSSGSKAKKAAAYKEAIWYFSMGIGMLPADKWDNHYDLTESIYLEAMEAEYLSSNFDRAELLSAELVKQARDETAKMRAHKTIYDARVQTLIRVNDPGNEPIVRSTSTAIEAKNVGADVVKEVSLIDLNTVIKASQAIAGEIELDRLLAKTMRIVIENAGAEKGVLIESRDEKLIIQAEGEIGQDQVRTMQEIPIEESGKVPLSVVNFVARTQTPVVLNDAYHDNVYNIDGYIVEHQVKSMLCLPIIHKGALSGLLYLENNLAPDIFTPDRLELLKVLSAQAAISLENARLYASQEKNIRDLHQAEESLKLNFERSATLLKLNQMTDESLQEVMEFAFEQAVRVTKSRIGYLAFLNEDETVLTMQLWSRSTMDECNIDNKPIDYQLDTVGLWGEAVRQRRPIITNDYSAHNLKKKGYPEGHVKVLRHMNVPVFDGSRIVLVAGVGNKEEEYNETDVQQLTLLMEGMWRLIGRRKAEEAIRETNEHLSSVLHAATAYSIIGTDPNGIITVFNEGAELMLGYRAEEVIDKMTPELIHDHDEVLARATELGVTPGFEVFVSGARKGETETREWTYLHKNGTRIPVTLTVTAMQDGAGALTGFIGIAQDITERKLIEEALYFVSQGGWMDDAGNFFDALAQFLGKSLDIEYVVIDRLDEEPNIVETLTVYAKGSIVPNLRYDLKGTPCENVMGQQLCSYPRGIQQLFPEDTLLAEMGVESYIGIPLWDSTGEPIGLIALMDSQPLSDDKLATKLLQLVATRAAAELESARSSGILRTREKEFRTLAENSPDNIARYDVNCRIFYANPAMEKTLGCSMSQMLGTTPAERVSIDGSIEYQEKITEVLQTGQEAEMDLVMPDCGEGERYHNVRFVAERGVDEAIMGVLALGRDVTERNHAEAEIRLLNQELEQRVADRTTKLEEANKELEAFAYSVSHDLRAPLRHIGGFLELLQRKSETAFDEQSQRYMNTISRAAHKMGLLIDDLLSFSRMGRQAMAFQKIELETMVRAVIQECELDIVGRNIEWRIGALATVGGDEALLRMVLTNLIGNALKFTRLRKHARIEVGLMPDQDSETVIFVRDNGVGFDMAYVDKLFGVFHRLHRADEFEGTGIGLANVRRIITRHGGRTWAEGKVNQGATFYFSLPRTLQGE